MKYTNFNKRIKKIIDEKYVKSGYDDFKKFLKNDVILKLEGLDIDEKELMSIYDNNRFHDLDLRHFYKIMKVLGYEIKIEII